MRDKGEEGGRRCRGGGEVRRGEDIFWMSSPVLCASSVSLSEPGWKWQQQQQHHP